ncbi:MAG: hypothetical protein GF309_01915 [Candidatus Lokiarchaeota archaeon]|nr:hypothetical protein [Candidatus Lokiarchaeota archaeon]
MSEESSEIFLPRITELIHIYCKKHAGSISEESIEEFKMIMQILQDDIEAITDSYPRESAQFFQIRSTPSKIEQALDMNRPTKRMIYNTLRSVMIALYVGGKKQSQEEYDQSEFAELEPGTRMVGFKALANLAELLHKKAVEGDIALH